MQLGSGTGTSFPSAVDTATTEVNAPASGKTKARAEVINDHSAAIIAIETSVKDGTALPIPTQTVVTGSRVVGTVYQNLTGRPLIVSADVACSSVTSGGAFFAYSDAANPPVTQTKQVQYYVQNGAVPVVFVVLPGNYYKVVISAGTPVVTLWTEWTL